MKNLTKEVDCQMIETIYKKEFLEIQKQPRLNRLALYWNKFRFGYRYLCSLNKKDIEELIEALQNVLQKERNDI